MAAQCDADDAAEHVLPLFGIADPGFDAGVVVDVIEARGEVGFLNEQLAALVELHAGAEDFPTRIVDGHHLGAGIYVEIAEVDAVCVFFAECLEYRLAERTDDFSTRAPKTG